MIELLKKEPRQIKTYHSNLFFSETSHTVNSICSGDPASVLDLKGLSFIFILCVLSMLFYIKSMLCFIVH